jgi:flagellar hook-associated protein 1 FlgK
LRSLEVDLPDVRSRLDELAGALVAEVNALHATGTNPDGDTGVDFFDPAGTTAWTMSLSAEVAASPDAVAAGTADTAGDYRGGANDVALALAGLRDAVLAPLGDTPGGYARDLVSSVGQSVRSALDAVEVQETLADQAEIRRMSFSGVSVDEELVRMIQFQTAYQAAARVVSTADEMLQSLFAM